MIAHLIQSHLQSVVAELIPGARVDSVLIRPSTETRFGDYQCNALMNLAREHKLNPRQLATEVVQRFQKPDLCAKVEIAGPGFINFFVAPEALSHALQYALSSESGFVTPPATTRTVIIDYSSPNVAKPMHVGHIRSTILGAALAKILRRLGHRVITDNHIGDWGTQFGMLLVGWKTLRNPAALESDATAEMERWYKSINAQSEADPSVRERAKAELVKLQAGDPENLAIWQEMIRLSRGHFDQIYQRLGVTFDHTLGESFYNPRLQSVVDELVHAGIARESQGAIAVFSDGSAPPKEDPFLIQKDGEWHPNPVLIRKSDGAFNYATTDLATLAYRIETWQPTDIVYVTDGRQQLHFRQVFSTFQRWQPEVAKSTQLVHVWFGSILGDDGRPYKTRSGETVKLVDLLDEAEQRALGVVTQKNPDLPENERREIARIVGLGAVRYADLLPNRQSDYIFSWDKMLSMQGNTAPYLQYAYTRTQSLSRRAEQAGLPLSSNVPFQLKAAEELALAKHLLNFGLALEAVAAEYRPNYLCNYLYDLAGLLSRFWEACPVMKAEEPERASRLALTHLTGRVLKEGLNLLGIETTQVM